ncbi:MULTISPECIES: phytanoyl-CoA dioxygenase family protein [unclassified Streptomyces]|uniref:phytanoyl-CoA dioxygenase family protein n=1 Tax=Streptomycetaceae TaxID=2062 RepID=UPI002E76570B|nr:MULTISPECIES: phytanoyl-CoA dioxygenase family protein [unclassified Streptomyces]MED7953432.1 phytanoyl-CoA dioxygenase family protein [Streptomyces sp. BE303]MEE1823102.1 phytanoyl-CoA dioxygenase family protein [Streptomyces sp. BE20]
MNATLTGNRTEAVEDLREFGYCLLESPLPSAEFERLRDRLLEVAEEERKDGTAFLYDGGNQRVFSLLNKGEEFERSVCDPLVLELMEEVLGFNFLLSSTHANIAGPGGVAMNVHADQTFARPPWPPYALVANSMWMLDDFTESNGATRLVPGTHRLGRQPDYARGEGDVETVPVCAPAGSVMIFDGRLWHQTGANTTDRPRHGILNYYCRGYVRQQQNFFSGLRPEVAERSTPAMRRLLGFENYFSLGLADGLE